MKIYVKFLCRFATAAAFDALAAWTLARSEADLRDSPRASTRQDFAQLLTTLLRKLLMYCQAARSGKLKWLDFHPEVSLLPLRHSQFQSRTEIIL
jgi:hypothetical protein